MVLKARNAIIPMVGIALTLQATSCKKDKDSRTDLLVGEWEMVKLDGAAPDYKVVFEFEKNKDLSICTTEEQYNLTLCYEGDWEWVGSKEDEIDLDWTDPAGDQYTASIKIESLSKDELVGEFTSDGDTYDVVLEKID